MVNRKKKIRHQQALNIALQHHKSGNLRQAEIGYRKILHEDPKNFDANHFLGVLAYQSTQYDMAIELISTAIKLSPKSSEAHYNLAAVFRDTGQNKEAEQCLRRTIQLNPTHTEAHNNLGVVLVRLGIKDDAEDSFRQALVLRPDYAQALNNLGSLYHESNRLTESVKCYRTAIKCQPKYTDALYNLGVALTDTGELNDAEVSFQHVLSQQPIHAKATHNLLLLQHYSSNYTNLERFENAREYDRRISAKAVARRNYANPPEPERQLKIGLISGDFRQHSVSCFLESLFSTIDQRNLELVAYANQSIEDETTKRLQSHVTLWRNIENVSDPQLATNIAADAIDILIDLSGHTAHNRLSVFTWKPAPIQVTWLGYSATTGLESMDYILADRWVIPAEDEDQYTETPWRMPDCYLCFTPPDLDIKPAPMPALTNGYITFGSFNNLTKMTDEVVACWSEILDAVPGSKLFLRAKQLGDAGVLEATQSRFANHHIPIERLILKGPSRGRDEVFSDYNKVDIALDPFPYAGTTTSVESLWMGVPVLSKQGDRFVSRVGESILHNLNMTNWIAVNEEDYRNKAIKFSADLHALSLLRSELSDRIQSSPLCNAKKFTKNLEDALRSMWQRWCAKQTGD